MRLYAFLRENLVVKVDFLDEQNYSEYAKDYQLIIDVEDLIITPQVGWRLNGNQLVPPPEQVISLQEQIKARIMYYQSLAPALLAELYAGNTLMGITIEQSDAMFSEYSDVILRLSQGAFPSAIYKLQQKTPSGFVTQPMLDAWILKIQQAMV